MNYTLQINIWRHINNEGNEYCNQPVIININIKEIYIIEHTIKFCLTITGIILAHFARVWTGKLTYLRAWNKKHDSKKKMGINWQPIVN